MSAVIGLPARWIVAVGFASMVQLTSAPALACDAPPSYPDSPKERLDAFDVVARGTVKSSRSWTRWTEHGWDMSEHSWWTKLLMKVSEYDSRIVINVDEAWKGVVFDEIVVQDDGPDTCCGMRHVEVGDEVLVFAKAFEGTLWIDGRCAPMIPLADAQADLDYLGPGQREFRSRAARRLLGYLAALPILLGGLLLWRRRVRRTSAGAGAASPAG